VTGHRLRDAVARATSAIGHALRKASPKRTSSRRYAVTVVSPPGYIHSAAFSEVAETIHFALQALGHDSVITTDGDLAGRQHIVLGSNFLPAFPLPLAKNAIVYNLEQVDVASSWLRPELITIFRRHELWDYSQRNVLAFQALGVHVNRVLPIGYAAQLTRLQPAAERDIDVLFVGSMNARRKAIIDGMRAAGLQTEAVFGVYGTQRDAMISRAKLLLNIHFYEAKVLEIVRLSYWLANRCAVLSERGADPQEDEQFAGGVAFAPYDDLVSRARALIAAPDERDRLARRGFEIMSARPAADYLRGALAPAG